MIRSLAEEEGNSDWRMAREVCGSKHGQPKELLIFLLHMGGSGMGHMTLRIVSI